MNKIKILGRDFDIKYENLKDKGILGETLLDDNLILLDNSMNSSQEYEVLLHEVCHVILGLGGLAEYIGPELEEAIVTSLGYGLSSIDPRVLTSTRSRSKNHTTKSRNNSSSKTR